MATIRDERKDKSAAAGYIVFTDGCMSGWGQAAGGRSVYALACSSEDECYTVLVNGKRRTDMKRGRHVRTLKAIRLGPKDHMSVVNRENAKRWYEPGAFTD